MWARTIRFRLTVTYSALLFGLATLVVLVIYLAVRHQVESAQVPPTVKLTDVTLSDLSTGRSYNLSEVALTSRRAFSRSVNEQTLDTLRQYSLSAIALLLVVSLVIGWWLSGRLLAPVARITQTAREITATDISRRIRLDGPDDELRRLADTIDAMLDRLDAAFTAQRQIVDDASHELRNPLAIIRANVDAVLSRSDTEEEDRTRAVAVVSRATDRMARLVDDLLASARRAGPAFIESDVDLASVGREALDEQELVAREAGVHLRSGLVDGVSVVGDRDALRRALGNLLSNAVRFSPPGGDVLLAGGRLGDWAWLAVRDQGPGIGPDDQGRVFDRFSRIVGRRARHDGHAGLGLAIVRQIVESHRGRVALQSEPGRGSTFILWLPVRDASLDGLPVPMDVDPIPH
nr:HAMP domain-containing sensor histidine kinase [Motilibacter deserti]